MKIAILDDYQSVSEEMADWSTLPTGTQVERFRDHLDDEDQLVERLQDFQIVMNVVTMLMLISIKAVLDGF